MNRIIPRGRPDSGSPVHFQLTLEEHLAARCGGYVDPDRYREGHRDFAPEVACRHGGYHIFMTRDPAKVTCAKCLER